MSNRRSLYIRCICDVKYNDLLTWHPSASFAVIHNGVRTSPPVARGRTLAPPWLTAPPPPTRGGGGNSRVITQQHRQSTPQPEHTPSPFLPASPSPGVDSGRLGAVQACTPAPPPPLQQGSQASQAGWVPLSLPPTKQLPPP
jgi:hypothetical protein